MVKYPLNHHECFISQENPKKFASFLPINSPTIHQGGEPLAHQPFLRHPLGDGTSGTAEHLKATQLKKPKNWRKFSDV